MKYLEEFPITALFLGFFLSSCLFAYCGTILKGVLIGIIFILLFLTARKILKLRPTLRIMLLYVLSACAAAGALSFVWFDIVTEIYDKQNGKTDTVTLRITDCEYTLSYTARYQAVILKSDTLPFGSKLLLDTPIAALDNGTLLRGDVIYTSLSEAGSDSFDSVRYYLPKRIMITAEDISLEKSGSRFFFSISGFFEKINEKLSSMILAHVRYDSGGMAAAVLLGNKDSLTDSIRRDFRRIGISHLLVVSGTHFSVILTFTERAMRRLLINRRLRACLNMVLIVFIMLLTGFTPSVVRAGIMHLLAQLALLIFAKANMIHSLAFSGTLLTFFNPYSAMDCSLQLSFIATYSCIFYLQHRGALTSALRKRGIRLKNRFVRLLFSGVETILMTSLITLNTLPLMWLYFGEISLITIPVNVIFIPLVSGLMYLTGLYLLLYPLRIFLFPMAALLNGYCRILEAIASCFSEKDWIMLPVNYSFTVFFLIPLTILLIILPFVEKITRKRVLLSACGICAAFFAVIGIWNIIDRQNVYLSYLPEKKNDGFVLKADGKALICDMSDASFSYTYQLTDEVLSLHCCEIETLLLTHYHSKHVQLLERLSQREILRSVVLPEPIDEREEGIYHSLLESAEIYGLAVTTIPAGGSYLFGGTEITLFERTYLSRSTHPITAVEIAMPDETAVIASCSFNQSAEAITNALENADYPILGRHSPVYKKAIDLSFDKPTAVVLSEQAYEWLTEESLDNLEGSPLYLEPDSFRIKISRGNTVSTQVQSDETAS